MSLCNAPGLTPIEDVLDTMHEYATAFFIDRKETVSLLDADNRVLATDIISPMNVPPHNNSAMDGYALRFDHNAIHDNRFTLVGHALAGQPFGGELLAGECVRITTGAVVPSNTDAVVMQENVTVDSAHITVSTLPEPGNNIRLQGEDITKGNLVLARGTRLQPQHLALLASLGIARVDVFPRLRVAVFATGDELTYPGEALKEGAIYESNRYALIAKLSRLGCDIEDLGIIDDTLEATVATLNHCALQSDVIISCGGVSVGDADFVKDAVNSVGELNLWKVAMKPGKPFAFGRVDKSLFFGLPGNPVSAFATFDILVQPIIMQLQCEQLPANLILNATLSEPARKQPGRADYQRGVLSVSDSGQVLVSPLPKQGSGLMTSITQANCYIVLEQDRGRSEAGERVNVIPFKVLHP
ncbi:molybdopterin molybdotransferase MoeA [Aestuariibacter sp. AA17]|uniref:Molybdopterin molybdenumtransferase n=1 Tax=Fluctibacter corallii TaxID=2984329 RepID=A0ABT3A5Q2_9ALTE|nr:gephyrin-like molybdotransferase Glp [Aestuariibacter sp. AA17]MCV2884009.1 molybdopterin molybdotransferase MoeA [Aestuariibacter sp. AA17]